MHIVKRNIDLKISNEDLKYAMGFIIDKGLVNTPSSNYRSGRSPNKQYIGTQLGESQFYLEDKNYWGSWQNISIVMLMGYTLENIQNNKMILTLVLKKREITLYIALLATIVLIPTLLYAIIPIITFHFPLIMASLALFFCICNLVGMLINFHLTRSDLKKQVETRVRVREYHQNKRENKPV